MNVGEVLSTVEQGLLLRQLSSLERFILCQSWLGRGYSEMAPDCAYSIAHIKDIGSQLWQALSKALGKRVTKKNLFLVLKQYLLSHKDETVTSDSLSVTLVEAIDPPLTPTTNQLPVATEIVEASYSEDSEQLLLESDRPTALQASYGRSCPSFRDAFSSLAVTAWQTRTGNRCELATEEGSWLEKAQQKCQTSTDHTQTENNLKAPKPREKSSLLSPILNHTTASRDKTAYLDFQGADATVSAEINQFLHWLLGLTHSRTGIFDLQPKATIV